MELRTARILNKVRLAGRRFGLDRTPLASLMPSTVRLQFDGFEMVIPRQFFTHYTSRVYEPVTQSSFHEVLRRGMTFVDVGAHVGYFTLLASKLVGSSGQVHSLEPFEDTLRYLTKNVAMNDAANVAVHALAAGSQSRERAFHVTGSTDSNGFFDHPNTPTIGTVLVREEPLDRIVAGPVHAVKIDVEGGEVLVLEGMHGLIKSNPNMTIWAEWMPACMRNAGMDPLDLPNRLIELGFSNIEVLNDADGTRRPLEGVLPLVRDGATPDHWYVNLLATSGRKAAVSRG